jgi:hypothetical protein
VTGLEGLAKRHRLAAHAIGRENAEDRIGFQHAQHALARVDRERLAFAQVQQARDGIDVGACEDDALDRRGAKALAGMEDGIGLDLLAEVRRGIEQEPTLTVGAHGQRRLGSRCGFGVAGTGATACLRV